jgi:putative intracellular protease/amidase
MRTSTVHLFVFDGMADWEAAYAIAAINNPQFQLVPRRFRVATVAASLDPITTMGGMRIQPDLILSEVSPVASSLLILPGGDRWESRGNEQALEKARNFVAVGIPVAAICAATRALARAGLLDNRRHTSNAREYLAGHGYHGGSHYCDVPAVTDKHVITASGIAPIDFAREIFKTLNLYSSETLDAWYALFKHGDCAQFFNLTRSAA